MVLFPYLIAGLYLNVAQCAFITTNKVFQGIKVPAIIAFPANKSVLIGLEKYVL